MSVSQRVCVACDLRLRATESAEAMTPLTHPHCLLLD